MNWIKENIKWLLPVVAFFFTTIGFIGGLWITGQTITVKIDDHETRIERNEKIIEKSILDKITAKPRSTAKEIK